MLNTDGWATVTSACAGGNDPSVPVIVVCPGDTAVTMPRTLTVATAGLDDEKVSPVDTGVVVPSVYVSVVTSVCVAPPPTSVKVAGCSTMLTGDLTIVPTTTGATAPAETVMVATPFAPD